MWSVAELDEEYIRRMEDLLAVYEKPLSERVVVEKFPGCGIYSSALLRKGGMRTAGGRRAGQATGREFVTAAVLTSTS